MNIENIGQNIAILRKEKGVKQEVLARYVGVSAQAVSKWENGGVPDTEILPKIADFFGISIDRLFGRAITDYSDIKEALMTKIVDAPKEDKIKLVFNYCWDMERAMMLDLPHIEKTTSSIKDAEDDYSSEQVYSSILYTNGFTRMGIANRSQYFLIVPDAKSSDEAYFDGIDYLEFFKDFSDKALFDACVFFHKRESSKSFTTKLLVKSLGYTEEKVAEIIQKLEKYDMIHSTQIEMDDEIQTVYRFRSTPSFVALLIFAREIISPPNHFCYFNADREKPYLNSL